MAISIFYLLYRPRFMIFPLFSRIGWAYFHDKTESGLIIAHQYMLIAFLLYLELHPSLQLLNTSRKKIHLLRLTFHS